MQRATRLLQPLGRSRPCPRASCIPHAGPSNLSRRVLSTTQLIRPVAPFSALRRSQAIQEQEEIEVPRRTVLEEVKPGSDNIPESEEIVDEAGRANVVQEEQSLSEENRAWEDVDEAGSAQEIERSSLGRRIDIALRPFVQPVKPRPMLQNEPIILPLSSFESADPTQPAASGVGIALPNEIFNETIRRDILHSCVVWWLAYRRRGTHNTLSRSEVAFSKTKIRPQKGSGKARQGTRGSPILRKGGRAHPKRNRDWSITIPRKVMAAGMRMALSAKLYMGTLRVVDNLNAGGWQTTRQARRALTKGPRLSSEYWPYPTDGPDGRRLKENQTEQEEEAEWAEENKEDVHPAEDLTEPAGETASIRRKRHVMSRGFDTEKKGKLSILFLYPPTKPATEIWDFARPLRNIPGVEIMSTDEVEVFHLLQYHWVVMEADCVDALSKHAGQIRAATPSFPEAEVQPHTEIRLGRQQLRKTNEIGWHVGSMRKAVQSGSTSELGISAAAPNVISLRDWRRGHLETERPLEQPTSAPMRKDHVWIMNKWRRNVGRKSFLKTFGHKPTAAYRLKALRAWKKIRRAGMYATADRVALEINQGKVGGKRAVNAVVSTPPKNPGRIRRRKLTQARKLKVRHILKDDEGR